MLQVLQAALKWILHDPSTRHTHTLDILSHIRILIIPEQKIHRLLLECSDLSTKVLLHKYIKDFNIDRKTCLKQQLKLKNIQPHQMKARKSAKKNIYVLSGTKQSDEWRWSDGVTLNHMEKLDLQSSSSSEWLKWPEMHLPRCGHGAAVLNGQIYVVGGENNSLLTDTVEFYDPVSNKWEMAASLNHPRSGHGVCTMNDAIYAMGGWVGETLDASVEEYDPETNAWTIISQMPSPRFGMGVVSYQGIFKSYKLFGELT